MLARAVSYNRQWRGYARTVQRELPIVLPGADDLRADGLGAPRPRRLHHSAQPAGVTDPVIVRGSTGWRVSDAW